MPALQYEAKQLIVISPNPFVKKNEIKAVKAANSPKLPPHIALIVGVLAVSTASLFIRYAQVEAPSLVIAAFRMSLAALILAPFAYPRYKGEMRALSRKELGLAALAGLFLALHFATWILSLEYTSVASSVVIVTTNPLWVALLAPFFLNERMRPAAALGLLVALTGGVVVAMSDACLLPGGAFQCPPWSELVQGRAFWGDVLALLGAWAGAGYMLIGRKLRPTLSLTPYIFVVYGISAIVLLVMVAFSGQPVLGFSPSVYFYMLLLALIPQILGHSSFNWALAHLPASFVSIALLAEPVGSTLLAYLFLDETPSGLKIFGALLILGGIMLATLKPAAKTPPVYN